LRFCLRALKKSCRVKDWRGDEVSHSVSNPSP
jgi:hypothetical protein